MGLLCRFEVGAQHAGPAEVDVRRAMGLVGVVVDEHADDVPQRARHRDLARAQQRHAVEAQARAATAGNSASRSSVRVKMQLTTSSGPISLRAMISRISSSVASRIAGDSLTSTVVAPRRAKRRIGAPSCQSCAAWPSRSLACLAGCGGGDKLQSPPPSAPAAAHGHEPRLPGQRGDPGALLVRRRQGAAGAALRRRARRGGRAGAHRRRPRRGRLRALDRLRPGARHARAGRHRAARRRARARTRPARPGWTPPARRAAPTATSSACTRLQARERARARAPSPTTSSPRCGASAGGGGLLVGRYARG